MQSYPIMLDLSGRLCVVVGAGPVGQRKAASLAAIGAQVRLVSIDVPPQEQLPGVEIVASAYRPEHMAGATLVFVCTDDRQTNARIAADARCAGALVNAVDQPEDCDFYVPATVADGEVVVAIGTGGASPSLAAALKERIAAALPERLGEFAAALRSVRQFVIGQIPDMRRRKGVMDTLARQRGYDAFRAGGQEAMMQLAKDLLAGR